MFKEGQLVMYGSMGVCKIAKIGPLEFGDDKDETLYYFLEPLYKSGTFYAPVDNKKISLRKIISKKAAKDLISEIGKIKGEIITTPSIQQLSQQYQDIIDLHDCKALLSLKKSILAKEKDAIKNKKKLGQIDRKFMKKADELLYGELAAALNMDIEKVEVMVSEKLGVS